MVKVLLSLLLTFIVTPAFAEEVVTPVVETPIVLSTPEAYVPPAEASNGTGGWAVVDPVTGSVHGVIVCTIDVCGPNGSFQGVLPGQYMGCTNCNLRFQTNRTSDGNVAGYSGAGVSWNESSKDFSIVTDNSNNGEISVTKKKLIPSKTTSDGVNIATGIVDIKSRYESVKITDYSVKIDTMQKDIDSPTKITIEYSELPKFNYDSVNSVKTNIDSDVEAALVGKEESVVSVFKLLTNKVKTFLGIIFGGNNE